MSPFPQSVFALQGYFLGHPLPAEHFMRNIQRAEQAATGWVDSP
ncbi:hypothetical protein [Serratia proteamaculans]